jgi:hypothetical protein
MTESRFRVILYVVTNLFGSVGPGLAQSCSKGRAL